MRVGECLALVGLAVGSAWGTFLVLDFQPTSSRKANKFEWNLAAAQCNIGGCYRDGFGVAKDTAEAAKWFRKAAERGYDDAQYALGSLYCEGEGIEKNMIEAAKWLRKAVEQGHQAAKEKLAEFK